MGKSFSRKVAKKGISWSQGVRFLLHEVRTDCFQCGRGTSVHQQCQVGRWSTPSSALDTVSFKIFCWSDVYKMGSRWGFNFHFCYWWSWIQCHVLIDRCISSHETPIFLSLVHFPIVMCFLKVDFCESYTHSALESFVTYSWCEHFLDCCSFPHFHVFFV